MLPGKVILILMSVVNLGFAQDKTSDRTELYQKLPSAGLIATYRIAKPDNRISCLNKLEMMIELETQRCGNQKIHVGTLLQKSGEDSARL